MTNKSTKMETNTKDTTAIIRVPLGASLTGEELDQFVVLCSSENKTISQKVSELITAFLKTAPTIQEVAP